MVQASLIGNSVESATLLVVVYIYIVQYYYIIVSLCMQSLLLEAWHVLQGTRNHLSRLTVILLDPTNERDRAAKAAMAAWRRCRAAQESNYHSISKKWGTKERLQSNVSDTGADVDVASHGCASLEA